MDWRNFHSNQERSERRGSPKHKEVFQRAKKELELADHLLYVTFPLVNDLKFLLAITEHLINASKTALEALLEYERYYKNIDLFPTNFAVMIDIFDKKCKARRTFEDKDIRLLKKMLELSTFIEKSQMKFHRDDKYVITADPYDIKTIDLPMVKRYLRLTKSFIESIEVILKKDG